MKLVGACFRTFVMMAILSPMLRAAPAFQLPSPGSGNVNGLQGLLFWPVLANDPEVLVDPVGCEVHLSLHDETRLKHSYACGTWFAPPAGRYTVWLAQGSRISEQFVLAVPGAKFEGDGVTATVPLGPAASIRLDPAVRSATGQTFRFLSLDATSIEFDLSLSPEEARVAFSVPARRAVAGIFGPDGSAVALTAPLLLAEGEDRVVIPKTPVDRCDVMVVASKRSAPVRERSDRGITAALQLAEKQWPAEVTYETDGRFVAIWYGLPQISGELRIVSKTFESETTTVDLRSRQFVTVRTDLSLRKPH